MRKSVAAALAVVGGLGAAGVLGMAGTASAAEQNSVITRPTTQFTSQSNQSQFMFSLSPGTRLEARCWVTGQQIGGNNIWFRVKFNDLNGFVHRDAISAPVDLKYCQG